MRPALLPSCSIILQPMRRIASLALSSFFAFGLAWSGPLQAAPATPATLKLRLLQTSDLHMNLLNYDYYQDRETEDYGLARTIPLIQRAREEAPNHLLFDNGDLLQGSPLGDQVARVQPLRAGETHPAYKVLNLLGVDAANVGNHEFNYGLPFLRQALAGASFPYVSANVMERGAQGQARHAFTPYVLLKRQFKDEAGRMQTLKIGVIGFVPPQIMQWDRRHLQGQVEARDIVETARTLVPQMRAQGADLVVALAHSGFEKTEQGRLAENTVAELARVPGIDALLFGHAHAEFPSAQFAGYPGVDLVQGRIHGVPAAMPGRWGDHLAVVDLTLQRQGRHWVVRQSHAELRPIFDRASRRALVAADPMVAHVIAREHGDTLKAMRAPVAHSELAIHSYFSQVQPSLAVELVARAQLAYLERAVQGTAFEGLPLVSAAAPFKAGGRQGWNFYTDIPAGPLAAKHVADLYLYPNQIKVLKLSGAELREWLEMSAGQFRRIDPEGPVEQELLDDDFRAYNFDSLYAAPLADGQPGLSYAINISQPARYSAEGQLLQAQARRIEDLRYHGRPLDAQAQFLVITNHYRAHGGGGFPGLNASKVVIDAPDENREAVAAYLAKLGRVAALPPGAAPQPSWRVLPVPGVALKFRSGQGGMAQLPSGSGSAIELISRETDGSAWYRLKP
ncbi:bifunctional 2',3'-cyclic-nucleotide 2'-phosphodiesterase/3'-nucleotidase [Paucibacter sp. DJ1R-11]|uniref:bifunctional 2',3'-cyclic-nucleotide 2'-phosphodiesterase/3'-nucleotidase n=1 Tax=Paucibacter sp. DJ1R-11 TaxID=2893556 RepID=UPI0021E3709F|nr:bifunctional 2',3'-cyclic-nucleotide 2'-phosphodiesterase/3'-nucleotidase [Paucibacter sp. DJ1R-11]MCV2364018.1 bifunctional 2',3'-cyclic-nucleotide 2'-phosphodiesterase/3'-nucleotidase [Paucibacter sp. DJ1R-11]